MKLKTHKDGKESRTLATKSLSEKEPREIGYLPFKVIKKKLYPTIIGKFIPARLRNFFGMIFGDIADTIEFHLRVVK